MRTRVMVAEMTEPLSQELETVEDGVTNARCERDTIGGDVVRRVERAISECPNPSQLQRRPKSLK